MLKAAMILALAILTSIALEHWLILTCIQHPKFYQLEDNCLIGKDYNYRIREKNYTEIL